MINYKVWNKKDSINGIDAATVMQSQNIRELDEVFLITTGNRVTEIQFKDIISSNYNLDPNLSCEQVAQRYLEIRAEEELKQQEDMKTLETQQLEIDTLKKQNTDLENALVELAGLVGGA